MTLPCPQCGAEIRIQESDGFVRCPFCSTSLVLEVSGIRRHLLYRPRLRPAEVLPVLRRFCDVHRLAAPTLLLPPKLTYYPFWRYPTAGRPRLVCAWPTVDARWSEVQAPDAEQLLYDPDAIQSAPVIETAVEEPAARARLGGPGEGAAGDLVHIPFYDVSLRCGGSRMPLSLDACSGRVYADAVGEQQEQQGAATAAWLPVCAFLLMLCVSAALPAWWLAAAAIAPFALVLYWAMAGSRA